MDINILNEIEEWGACGLYEGMSLPFPRMYGLAYRRIYENMPVRILPGRFLAPCEPFYMCKASYGDNAQGGGIHHAFSSCVNIFHSGGLEYRHDIAKAKKEKYPQYAAQIDEMSAELPKYLRGRSGYIHSNPDIYTIIEKGFCFLTDEIEKGLEAAVAENDTEGYNLLLSLADYACGIKTYHAKISDAIKTAEENEAEGDRKKQLGIISKEFDSCFLYPAKSFISGLLAVNFMWMLDGCDSIGRIDYALGKLYESDLESGKLDFEFANVLICDLLNYFEIFNGWNMQIGGYTPEGGECYNALTRAIIACDKLCHQRRPNVCLRVTENMPDDIYELSLDSVASGTGKPAFYNDDLYIGKLLEVFPHIKKDDACMLGFGGCTETMLSGISCVDSLIGDINLAWLMNLAVFDGIDILTGKQEGLKTGSFVDFSSMDEFVSAFFLQIKYHIDKRCEGWCAGMKANALGRDPQIMRTMFTRGCIEKRRSFEAGGALYNWSCVSFSGTTTVIDSVNAIGECVFEKKLITPKQLAEALRSDFRGYEDVKRILETAVKFGNDLEDENNIGIETVKFTWEYLGEHSTVRGEGGKFIPSVILFNTYGGEGRRVSATSDGRRSGQALNDSVGAYRSNDVNGPTALINSVLRQPLSSALGTPVFNIRINKPIISSPEGKGAVKTLLKSFFARGGMQMQITVADTEQLRAAQKNPELYKNLIVRIGGFSEYFVYLSPDLQETVIARSEHYN